MITMLVSLRLPVTLRVSEEGGDRERGEGGDRERGEGGDRERGEGGDRGREGKWERRKSYM